MRHVVSLALFLAAGGLAAAPAIADDEVPLFVNYGLSASGKQGDNDHHQAIYLSVPAATAGKLYLRIFDPEIGGAFDQIDFRHSSTAAKYSVFGGDGGFVPSAESPEAMSKEELTGGKLLATKTYRASPAEDGTWQTLAELDPADASHDGDRLVYRLVVDMISGLNGNVFDVTLSTKADDNVAPEGLRIFSYSPTVRMPSRGVLTELRFRVPSGTRQVTVGNFDAANGSVFLTSKFVSYPLVASGQNKWETTTVPLDGSDTELAVTLSGGREYPNDSSFYAKDADGNLIPFELPARLVTLNNRPTAAVTRDTMGTCTSVKFDGSLSSDPEGDPLTYTWRFGDGESATGVTVTHDYKTDGRYPATLEVTDNSPQFGNGAAATVEVFVKKPPVARSEKRTLVAVGDDVRFDGSPSTASFWKIATNQWSFGDGASLTGDSVTHAFANPGLYTVTHTVIDNSGHPCNTASETFSVRVNAPPVSKAGPDQRVAIGEEVVFDGRSSYDPDGKLVTYEWDFGDGSRGTGPIARHTYAKAASYDVRLRVRDDSDVANSSDDDHMIVIVNDPPLPDAGADKNAAIGEVLTFDASGSKDRDGAIIGYEWDFGDGEHATGAVVTHAYARSGTYTATLTVTDDSTTSTRSVSDTASVRINEPPVADAGPDQLVTASLVQFDGSASHDADDSIALFEWDFGDGTTGSGAKPTHVYRKPGTYDVTLTVTDASKTIRSSASDIVRIVVNAVPIADAGPDLVGAPGESLLFQGSRSLDPDGTIADYEWDFRDGGTASGKTVKHAFARPGTYSVRLKVADNTGQPEAVDYAETSVFINSPPVADAGPEIQATPGDEVTLSGAGSYDTDGKLIGYRWDFSDSDEPVDGVEVKRSFKEAGIYTAQLTVTDDSGASNALATDTVRIVINHPPVASAGTDVFTASSTITFDGGKSTDADGDALAYAWDFGDGSTGTGQVVTHTYKAGGSYPVLLTVNDGTGLKNGTATSTINVRINRPPVSVAGTNQQVCTGDIIVLDGSKSSDPEGGVLRYSWNFGDGTTSEI
ncbi:MAG TPA: PKD domain-containing protein, partial [Bauldia sp.]|nr:PKD domain-containing protein [Bauldia sp.]